MNPKGLVPVTWVPNRPTKAVKAGEALFSGDCLKVGKDKKVYRYDCLKAKWVAYQTVKINNLVICHPLN